MKTPNYEHQVGKHPIPHAKGIAKGENRDVNRKSNDTSNVSASSEEE